MKYAKIGQIQWLFFWLALFGNNDALWVIWLFSLLMDDKE